MKNIIDKIYNLHLNTADFPLGVPDKNSMDKEWELYNFLYENLSGECKKSFSEYIDIRGIRQSEEIKNSYKQGFKTAINLILEILKE